MNEDYVPAYEPLGCPEWQETLSKFHPDDLTPDQWEALQRHLEVCQQCAWVRAAYAQMREKLHRFFGMEGDPWTSDE